MAIVLTGLSHKTAPVEVRECHALPKERAVEPMLVSAANKIAHPAIQVMRRSHEAAREREARLEREAGAEPGLSLAAGLLAAA